MPYPSTPPQFLPRKARLLCAALLLMVSLKGAEENYWPILVRLGSTDTEGVEYLGPLVFAQSGQVAYKGLRPIWLETKTDDGKKYQLLYPFFTWRQQGAYRSFSFFQLVNSRVDDADPTQPDHQFDVWPLYFSRTTADPTESYHAFFPLGGELKNRFGKDQISFTLFPLYLRTEKSGKQITHVPWPFLRFITGDGHHGFEFWPLFGHSGRADDYDHQFYLWPLIYKSVTNLDEETPDVKIGVLPFYSKDTGPGYIRENYVWPFFGYTHRTAPYHYDEQRYFWPLIVQGRGDDRYINRWAPLYTHSIIKGFDKTWVLWPLFRNQRWQADGVAQHKSQFLFFLYWSLEQQSLANPTAPKAHKTHLWPLFSSWDNGAGRRQMQALSPFEVFFPGNDTVRQLWSPLFALYRYDQNPDTATTRHSFLWNAVTYRHSARAQEFHLGPLFSVHSDSNRKRIALGNGLIGLQRRAGRHWRLFLFDFRAKADTKETEATSP